MRKILGFILLFIAFSIIYDNSHYHNFTTIDTHLNIPVDLSHQNFEDHADNHDYFIDNIQQEGLSIFNLAENQVEIPILHSQQPLHYIWQPPEAIV